MFGTGRKGLNTDTVYIYYMCFYVTISLNYTFLYCWKKVKSKYVLLMLQTNQAKSLMNRYRSLTIARENYLTTLINGYQEKIKTLQDNVSILTNEQKKRLKNEMEKFKNQCVMGFRVGALKDGVSDLPTNIFLNFTTTIAKDCPLINDILETLIGNTKDIDVNKIKTNEVKMKRASHALSGLIALGNQKHPNDIQLFFGLLCLSYGGGKQFINMLNSIGLCLHWDSL